MRSNVRVELPAGQQGVAEPDDRLTVGNLELLQVPQQNLGVEVETFVGHQDDVAAQTLQPLQEGEKTLLQVEALQLLSMSSNDIDGLIDIDTQYFLPVETLVISSEMVGEARLGMDMASGPDEFIKTIFSPAVYSTYLK